MIGVMSLKTTMAESYRRLGSGLGGVELVQHMFRSLARFRCSHIPDTHAAGRKLRPSGQVFPSGAVGRNPGGDFHTTSRLVLYVAHLSNSPSYPLHDGEAFVG